MRRSVAGWLSALALVSGGCTSSGTLEDPVAAAGPDLPVRFTALGTEPFWAAVVDDAVLVYQTPEDQKGQRVALARRAVDGRTELSGTLSGEALVLRIGAGPCSDGMSDTVYPYSAVLRIGRQVLNGCANPR